MRGTRSIIPLVIATIAVVPGVAVQAASPQPAATPPALGELCTPDHRPFDAKDIHLTGPWAANDDGVYYLRQLGSKIAWNGMSGRFGLAPELGRDWNNVAIGSLAPDGTITVDWMDVPRGSILGGGTLTLRVQPDAAGDIEIVKVSETGTGFGGETFTPCAPKTLTSVRFQPTFSVHDAVGNGLGFNDYPGVLGMQPGDPLDSGITVWQIGDTSGVSCSDRTKLEPGAKAFLDWLHARSDLVVSDGTAVTVDGKPATSIDIKAAPGATACEGGWVRMWQSFGSSASVAPDSMARVTVLDVGDQTVAIEEWGLHQDQWLPLAQRIVDTIDFAN